MKADTVVRARIKSETKEKATAALLKMGLTPSEAIRLLMIRIAEEQKLPFEVRAPNSDSKAAISELESGNGKQFKNVKELMEDMEN